MGIRANGLTVVKNTKVVKITTAKRTKTIALLLGILIILQAARVGIKSICFLLVARTNYTDRVASMIAMVILSVVIIIFARTMHEPLSVFPQKSRIPYIIATVITAGLFTVTPIITKDTSTETIVLLLYSVIITPVFEELIFRGFIWNKLNAVLPEKWLTYIISALMFAVWHFGYIDSLTFRIDNGMVNVMLWKAATGLLFGIVLGALRLKTKNCYSTILLHGVMNLFGK